MLRQRVAILLLVGMAACTNDTSPRPTETASLQLSQPRAVHRATALGDGSVLLTGGCTAPGCGGFEEARTSDHYRPDGAVVPGPQATQARASGTATLLEDGRVLLTGGYPAEGEAPSATGEIFDPDTSTFEETVDPLVGRADHTATLLPDGRVLLAGGFGPDGRALTSTELFDPRTDRYTAGPDLSEARAAHVAVVIDAHVVLVGGTRTGAALGTSDVLYDGRWQSGPSLDTARVKAGVVPAGPHRALVIGGASTTEGHQRLATTELLTLGRPETAPGPRLSSGAYKLDGAVAQLPDGRAVIPAGDALEVFDPATEELVLVPGVHLDELSFRTVTPLGASTVLVAGGYDEAITPQPDLRVVTIPQRA